jgi:hypothetical protein
VKNILQNFYLFSKLSLSISLLLILILLGYLFYRSYSFISIEETIEVSKNNDLLNSINLNSSKIEKIELLLNENNSKLIDIIDTLETSKENNQSNLVLKDIQSDFNNIKLELKKLQNNLQKKENIEAQPAQIDNYNINKENTIQLIKYKFENGQDFSMELELLSKILGSQNTHLIEKLYLLNNNRFIGNKILLSNFKKETDVYISKNLLKVNRIINVILPYIKIEPSKKRKLSDNRLIIIENIYKQIEKKNYAKSINLVSLIDKDKKFFKTTLGQLSIAADFNKTLGDILDRG